MNLLLGSVSDPATAATAISGKAMPQHGFGAVQDLERALLADTGADETALHHRDVLGRLRNDIAQALDQVVERQAGMRGHVVGLLRAADHAIHGLFRAHVDLHAVHGAGYGDAEKDQQGQ